MEEENDFSQSSRSEHFFGHLIHVELSHVPPQKVSVSSEDDSITRGSNDATALFFEDEIYSTHEED